MINDVGGVVSICHLRNDLRSSFFQSASSRVQLKPAELPCPENLVDYSCSQLLDADGVSKMLLVTTKGMKEIASNTIHTP